MVARQPLHWSATGILAMDALRQRLKELDRDKFEELCCCLLDVRHPTANIRKVAGASGDCGVDAFTGDLEDRPTIWQVKAFANGVGKSQKEQIRESLRAAVEHFSPGRWILCLSIDMDVHAHRWFAQLTRSYAARQVHLGLWQAGDILSELIHRKSVRDHFFPEVGLDVNELRGLITRTGSYTTETLAALTIENAQQYLERLKAHDARFNYELVIATDQLPRRSAASVFSITNGATVVNAYARDREALQANPPRVTFNLVGLGVTKFQEFVRTGRPQEITGEELVEWHSGVTIPGAPSGEIESLHLGRTPCKRALPLRVTFGTAESGVVYDMIKFRTLRVGTDEIELLSKGQQPFILRVVIGKNRGTFRITDCWHGARFASVKKYIAALTALKETSEIELYDLDDERRICRAHVEVLEAIPSLEQRFVALITAGARIAETFHADLRVPTFLSQEDAQVLARLGALLDGRISDMGALTVGFEKDGSEERWIEDIAAGNPVSIMWLHPGFAMVFAGTAINTGPVQLRCHAPRFPEPDAMLREYHDTPLGGTITVQLLPQTPIEAELKPAA